MTASANVIQMALQIADGAARADIESFCSWSNARTRRWYNTNDCDLDSGEDVALAARYLEARGALERKKGEPHLVRLLPRKDL